jgi:transposase
VPDTPGTPDVVAALQAANARLRAENAELKAENAELRAQNAELAERFARLERLISRNSGNSSMPPSTDDLPGKKPPPARPRRGGGRRPGKQPGAPGAYLPWREHPDKTRDVFPEGTCACGRDLAGARDLGVRYSHQVTDLPEARAETIQYDRHEAECACGRARVADAPPEAAGVPGTVTYGLNFQAWCVFLMVTNQAIRALIILAGVICGDETPLRVGPGPKTRKKYLQVACTSLLTYYFLGDRDLASFKGFIYSDLHGTVVVHDRYQNYDCFDGISHQLCCQHLLRDLEDAAQAYPDAIWPGQIADALRGLIHAANLARDQGLSTVPAGMTTEHLKLFRRGVTVGLSEVRRVPGAKSKQPPARTLLECLRHREADVLRFLTDTAIPPTSNQAERDLRPSKTQQKISGRLRSEKTTRHRYAIRGYASTAVKHGIAVFTAIRDALAGNPWIPPIPATN